MARADDEQIPPEDRIPVSRAIGDENGVFKGDVWADYADSDLNKDEQLTEILMRASVSTVRLTMKDGSYVEWRKA